MIIVRKMLIYGTDPNVVRKKKAQNNCGKKIAKTGYFIKK